MQTDRPAVKIRKGARTRQHILETALRLFKENGYESTTMRTIAQEAGISLGNTYNYFKSKEILVQAFYERVHDEEMAACRIVLARESRLKQRLIGVLLTMLSVLEPHHRISVELFKSAADPSSPLSPFSPESEKVRSTCLNLFKELVHSSTDRIPDDLRAELPELLWLYQMGIVLFWIHDKSFGRIRTHNLVVHSAELISSLIGLVSMPLMLPFKRNLLRMLIKLKE